MLTLCPPLSNIRYPIEARGYSFVRSFGLYVLNESIVSSCINYFSTAAVPWSPKFWRPLFMLYWDITTLEVGQCYCIVQCVRISYLCIYLWSWYHLRTGYCWTVNYSSGSSYRSASGDSTSEGCASGGSGSAPASGIYASGGSSLSWILSWLVSTTAMGP